MAQRGIPVEDGPSVAANVHSIVGEAPTWDHMTGTLIWVDIHGKLVNRLDPESGEVRSQAVPQRIGCAVPTASGGLLLALEDGFWLAGAVAEDPRLVTGVEGKPADARFNDGTCDRAGNFVAGTIAADFRAGGGALYRLDRHGAVTTLLDAVTLSNGIAFSPDGSTMYYVDTRTRNLRAFHYEESGGPLGEARVVLEVADEDGHLDGMTVDSDGYLWIALHGAGQVRRYSPSGVLDATIRLPVSKVTSCAFGGADLGDLYITSSSRKIDLSAEPLAGAVFRYRAGVRGLPEVPFTYAPDSAVR